MMNEITASSKYEAAPSNGSRMNSAACERNITKKTHLRPMASESQAHRNRPEALPTEMMLTSPAATVALTPASATAIGEATVMPAVTLRNSSAHSTYHCQVFRASPRSYSTPELSPPSSASGSHPSGVQPSG